MSTAHEIKVFSPVNWTRNGQYLEAPVVMMTPGVRSGSIGPVLFTADELQKSVLQWQHVPLCLNHPMDPDTDRPVSVNFSDEIHQRHVIGEVVHAYFDPATNALKATIRVPVNSPVADQVQSLSEVSIGIFSDDEPTSGEYNGRMYLGISRNLRPDHLALLTSDRQGACSWADGCGVRANEQMSDAFAMKVFERIMNGKDNQMSQEQAPLMTPGVAPDTELSEEEKAQRLKEWEQSDILITPSIFAALQPKEEPKKDTDDDNPNDEPGGAPLVPGINS